MSEKIGYRFLIVLVLLVATNVSFAQTIVPITNFSVNTNGQAQIEVNSTTNNYYILQIRHHIDSAFILPTAMALGGQGSTVITEPIEAYPQSHYQVLEYNISNPADYDGDGVNDVTEFNNMPNENPFNFATPVDIADGQVGVNDTATFNFLALKKKLVSLPYLNGKEFAKFIIFEYPTDERRLYFINTNKHALHLNFATFIGANHIAPDVIKGQVTYHPNVLSNNGTLGSYAFNFTNNEGEDFLTIQQTHELIGASMPFLENNLSYYITSNNEQQYQDEIIEMQNSRVPVLFESDVYAGLDYWGLNQTEGYGLFRQASNDEVPGPKDIVLYESLPNTLPRVAGIMTSVIQTPLSHVNLRAIQDKVPNAYVREPLLNDTILSLLNDYVYYNVEQSSYTIRKATVAEVNDWFDKIRPEAEQIPPLNLDYRAIKPLDDITFDMFDGFGAKCTNVATMRRFGFEEGTIPDGFGIPFYYYRVFMEYNGFFKEIEVMLKNANFIEDRDVREQMLSDLRKRIRQGTMPAWMWESLADMQSSFPVGTAIRTRSSTNNEDLPGFSGAGLYDSKTQYPYEGHISKSVKQVYASLWNLRAYEERQFFRVNHYMTAMGVLCHANYKDEKVNGVGISADPIYDTEKTYYLNSQSEDALITNPGDENPEEMLLFRYRTNENNYNIIQYSSLVEGDSILMTQPQLDLLRKYLREIHSQFLRLYKAEGNPSFAMDIEYKITSDNRLAIKQARPWVQYEVIEVEQPIENVCSTLIFPNPANDFLNITCKDCNISALRVADIQGRLVFEKSLDNEASENTYVNMYDLPAGVYFISVFVGTELCRTTKIIKH